MGLSSWLLWRVKTNQHFRIVRATKNEKASSYVVLAGLFALRRVYKHPLVLLPIATRAYIPGVCVSHP